MIPFEEAYRLVMATPVAVETETAGVNAARGRILAEDVTADRDMPPFDKSAMDGYACRKSDLSGPIVVDGFLPAGSAPERDVPVGHCVKIMTGAPVPAGADCVVPVEEAEETGAGEIRFVGDETPDNIIRQAEDVRAGTTVLGRGLRIRPQDIAVLCTVGHTKLLVARRPVVAVLATGDELVEPQSNPGPAGIRNSNSYQLASQIASVGAEARYHGIAVDREDSLDSAINEAMRGADMLIMSGGVSAGDLDLVPGALARAGYELLFRRVAVKPGKPTVFGRLEISREVSRSAAAPGGARGCSVCFGLPGNPVSTFVIFELLVAPLLLKMMGHEHRAPLVSATLREGFVRTRTEREEWIPVVFADENSVRPVTYHGSAHIHALCGADGLIRVPIGQTSLAEDTRVTVRLL
jgi:molybdopterin molybdotransferase